MSGEWKYYYDTSDKVWFIERYSYNHKVEEMTTFYKSGKLKRREAYDTTGRPSGICYDENGKEIPFTPFVKKQNPPPGFDMDEFLKKNIHYPDDAKAKKLMAKVIVEYTVDTTGDITNVTVSQLTGYGFDDEAIRVIKLMPRWEPAMLDDKPLAVKLTQPIVFGIK